MDDIDVNILKLVQLDSRQSSAQIAKAVGVSVSTANERVRKLSASGHIKSWQAILEPTKVGADVCAFLLIETEYSGETEASAALCALEEVQELHHVSGAHCYLVKVRVCDIAALSTLLAEKIKPLAGVVKTQSLVVLNTDKENAHVKITQLK